MVVTTHFGDTANVVLHRFSTCQLIVGCYYANVDDVLPVKECVSSNICRIVWATLLQLCANLRQKSSMR